jgi:hypothetical protein
MMSIKKLISNVNFVYNQFSISRFDFVFLGLLDQLLGNDA